MKFIGVIQIFLASVFFGVIVPVLVRDRRNRYVWSDFLQVSLCVFIYNEKLESLCISSCVYD